MHGSMDVTSILLQQLFLVFRELNHTPSHFKSHSNKKALAKKGLMASPVLWHAVPCTLFINHHLLPLFFRAPETSTISPKCLDFNLNLIMQLWYPEAW